MNCLLHPPARQRKAAVRPPDDSPAWQEEVRLAEDYWFRYPDVRNDGFWGKDSSLGIRGARRHYQLYGRYEGRVFGPVFRPTDMEEEKELAEAYWRRYPDIAQDPVWGRQGSMGILGPRDHYHYYGRSQGRTWGKADR